MFFLLVTHTYTYLSFKRDYMKESIIVSHWKTKDREEMCVCSELAVGGSVFLNRAPDREARGGRYRKGWKTNAVVESLRPALPGHYHLVQPRENSLWNSQSRPVSVTTNTLTYQAQPARISLEVVTETPVTCHSYRLYPFSMNQSINLHLGCGLSLNKELVFLTPGVALILSWRVCGNRASQAV